MTDQGRAVIRLGTAARPAHLHGLPCLQLIDGFATTREHRAGRLAERIEHAGLGDLRQVQRWRTVLGSLELIVAAGRPRD